MPAPFPGVDPWLEDPARWPDFHLALISTLREVLNEALRPRYVVRAEERVYVSEAAPEDDADPPEADARHLIRPDLAVVARDAAASPAPTGPRDLATPVLVPTVVVDQEERERYLVIRVPGGEEDVTHIEVLSPTNKRGPASSGREAYLARRRLTLRSEVHLVELDLLRAGNRVPMARDLPPGEYFAIVSHAARRPECEVYPVGLRERLPVVSLPLRGDERAPLDLQRVLDVVYERGAYEVDLDYDRPPRRRWGARTPPGRRSRSPPGGPAGPERVARSWPRLSRSGR